MKIKICGLFRDEDIDYVNQVQPDYVGFVFAKSRRQITKIKAQYFRRRLLLQIQAVGVFVDAPAEEIIACLTEGIIDIAQLHGRETEEDIRYIKKVTGKPVIKAVKVQSRSDVDAWLESEADYLLFDSGAGSGQSFSWELLLGVKRKFFLAGGLSLENIEKAMQEVGAYALDLSSGAETDGIKDLAKMSKIVQTVRRQNQDKKKRGNENE